MERPHVHRAIAPSEIEIAAFGGTGRARFVITVIFLARLRAEPSHAF